MAFAYDAIRIYSHIDAAKRCEEQFASAVPGVGRRNWCARYVSQPEESWQKEHPLTEPQCCTLLHTISCLYKLLQVESEERLSQVACFHQGCTVLVLWH